jgi:arylsulfatase A-like enzyme
VGIADKKRRIYAAMVDNLDHNVGRILDELKQCGIRGNTLVVMLSDNGGLTSHGANNGPLRGGKSQTHEGGIRVPFIWSWPDGLPEGREVSMPISSLDLLPAFAAAAGIEPRRKPLDGVNVLPWLQGTADGRPHEQLCWLSHDRKQAIRLDDFKAIRTGKLPWQLYDLSADLSEKNDLAAKMPEKTAALAAAYENWLSAMPPARWPDPGKGNMVPLPSGRELIKQFK